MFFNPALVTRPTLTTMPIVFLDANGTFTTEPRSILSLSSSGIP